MPSKEFVEYLYAKWDDSVDNANSLAQTYFNALAELQRDCPHTVVLTVASDLPSEPDCVVCEHCGLAEYFYPETGPVCLTPDGREVHVVDDTIIGKYIRGIPEFRKCPP